MFVVVAGLAGWQAAFAQAQTTAAPADRANNVRQLSNELRWHDAEGHKQYLRIKEDRTKRLLSEVDGFISETVSPSATTAGQVKAGLDALLGHTMGEGRDSAAFSVNLPNGHFLIIGVELWRGGGAMSEDAMSFRAYRETENKFVLVADTDYRHTGDVSEESWEPLVNLSVKALPTAPVASQFWFIASAVVPPRMPPTVTMRLFAFDGERFRTVWTRQDFIAPDDRSAMQFTQDGGFTLSRMPDPHGDKVVIEQYVVTADGPQKVTEWETERR